MKNTFIFLFTLLAFASCANLTKNTVKEGPFLVKNGTAGDKTWYETLTLNRLSWYHELTLEFDLMMTSVAPQSSFNFWFSKDELEAIGKCGEFKIVLSYSRDTKVIQYSYLNEQLDFSGYRKIELPSFKKNFLQHPDAEMNSLRLYQVYGICRPDQNGKPLILSFPGFSEKIVN
jgi:hypothetical protein